MTDDKDPPEGPPPEPTITVEPAPEPVPPPEPATATEEDLRVAVGLPAKITRKPEKEPTPAPSPYLDRPATRDVDDADEDDQPRKKRGKLGLVAAVALLIGGVITAMVLVGSANADRYYQKCHADKITAERGRSFPPWGTSRLGGPMWKPIAIPPSVECVTRDTSDPAELTGWYLDALVEQAEAKLKAKEVTAVDQAQVELEQALLLARAPERQDQRKTIERLLGDVEYWRGQARVRAAVETLQEAGKRYDAAADKRPRHASDSAAWAAFVRRIAKDLAAGPGGVVAPLDAPEGVTKTDVPVGVALPVEEPAPAEAPDAGVPAIDAGLPQGGVLL